MLDILGDNSEHAMKFAGTSLFRLLGAVFFALLALLFYVANKPLSALPALLVGVFAAIHLAISQWYGRVASGEEVDEGPQPQANPNSKEVDSSYRDIVKQYAAISGTILGLVVALHRAEFTDPLILACTSLAISICIALLLLEVLSGGWIFRKTANFVSSVFHVQTWTLLLGIFALVSHVWSN